MLLHDVLRFAFRVETVPYFTWSRISMEKFFPSGISIKFPNGEKRFVIGCFI